MAADGGEEGALPGPWEPWRARENNQPKPHNLRLSFPQLFSEAAREEYQVEDLPIAATKKLRL
jgi:hypothetical protein